MQVEETSTQKVRVSTTTQSFEFEDMAQAKNRFPELDAYRGSRTFTGATDYNDGFLTFEAWDLNAALDQED